MAYFLFKCWHEQLFFSERKDLTLKKARVEIELQPITSENAHLVKELRGEIYEGQFLYQLSMGDFGYYAMQGGAPVGYGWVKHPGSDDYFFKISDGCRYLCRFFVHESKRGQGIYPELISSLVEREGDCNRFYIAVERGNDASVRGLSKLGFKPVREYGFVRGFKHTFNKKTLR
ncbi:MAG: GNAT family N-acetyltransferase [Clostridia bacterium]|nr:GNAT family N-acetyltransferase [Clostridia bacterium]